MKRIRNPLFPALLALLGLFGGSSVQQASAVGVVTQSGPRLILDAGDPDPGDFPFIVQTSASVSMLPGSDGWGYDNYGGSGRDGAEGRVTVVVVNDFTSGTVCNNVGGYTRVKEGNIQCCASTAGPKACIGVEEGIINLDTDVRLGSYVDYYGHFAPGAGIIWKETIPSAVISFCSSVATHQRIWSGDFRAGDDAPGIETQNRDSIEPGGCSDAGSPALSYIAYISSFIGWSVDELGGGYYCGDNLAFHGNVFAEPLDKSIHDDQGTPDDGTGVEAHPYGPVMGPGYRCGYISWQRNVLAHLQSRAPFIAAMRFAYANNVIYNLGDTDGNIGQGIRLTNDYDAATPNSSAMYSNIVRNLFVKGPNSASTIQAIAVDPNGTESTTRLPSGSQIYLAGNATREFTYADQLALKVGTFPGGVDAGAVISSAMPGGWETDMSGLEEICTGGDPNDCSDAEMLAFATKICAHAGPRPSVTDSSNRARTVCGHVLARISGTGDQGGVVNSVSGATSPGGSWPNISLRYTPNAGGYPTPGSASVNIFTGSGTCTGDPMPLNGTAPDDRVQADATLDNGLEADGRTAMEIWALNEFFCKGSA